MNLLENYNKAKQELYDHVGFVEDWTVYAIEDCTEYLWFIHNDTSVIFFENMDDLLDGDYYENEIYTQRFYPKWVYRGKDLTMIIVDTHTDGNKFFAFYDNKKETKNPDVSQ